MNLVKWLRKNKGKTMAVVVVFLMIAFLMPGALKKWARPDLSRDSVVAYFGQDSEITQKMLARARTELDILKMMYADQFLLSGRGDIGGILLCQVLFPGSMPAANVSDLVKQTVAQRQYRMSEKQINEFFVQTAGNSALFWLLLSEEARQAGCAMPIEKAGQFLSSIVPSASQNSDTAPKAVARVAQSYGIGEAEAVSLFSDFIGLLIYNQLITSSENVSDAQIQNIIARRGEKLDAEFVKFDTSLFIDTVEAPSQTQIMEHFEAYKNFSPRLPSAENPYGFGYKQPPKATLEYIALQLSDVEKLITPPTAAEAEDFYLKNQSRFITNVPSDPNDPNSEPIEKLNSYAEVAMQIKQGLLQQKITAKANTILAETRELTEAGFEGLDFTKVSDEELKVGAADYSAVAESMGKKHNIKLYYGRTGKLSAEDIQKNRYLGTLTAKGQSQSPVGLAKIVFSADALGVTVLGPFETRKPKMYENISPLVNQYEGIIAMARLIEAQGESEPKDINLAYAKNLPKIGDDQQDGEDEDYVLKDIIVKDIKRLTAMQTISAKAAEFIAIAKEKGWEQASQQFNELYGPKDASPTDTQPKSFDVQQLIQQSRMLVMDIETIKLSMSNNPAGQQLISMFTQRKQLIDSLYLLLPADSNVPDSLPLTLESKLELSLYVIKSLSRSEITTNEYAQVKATIASQLDQAAARSQSLTHFMPDNIIKRMKFRSKDNEEKSDGTDPDGAS